MHIIKFKYNSLVDSPCGQTISIKHLNHVKWQIGFVSMFMMNIWALIH